MLCCTLYLVASYVILSLRKALKKFMKMLVQNLFVSQLVILTRFPSGSESLLSSEKTISTPGFKIKFCVLETQC
jgi:hypothetical protein